MRKRFVLLALVSVALMVPDAAIAGSCSKAQDECYWKEIATKPLLKRNFFQCDVEFLYCFMRLVSRS